MKNSKMLKCYLCACTISGKLYKVNENTSHSRTSLIRLMQKLKPSLKISLDDSLCTDCYLRLDEYDNLCQMVAQSEATLKAMFDSVVEKPTPEEIEVISVDESDVK